MKSYTLKDARRLTRGTNDWREAVWNKWLIGYLTPRAAEEGEGDVPKAATPLQQDDPAPFAVAGGEDPTIVPEQTTSQREAGRGRGRQALRARLELILSRMDAIELSLDRVSERDHLARVQTRVQERALTDLIERLVDAQERHTQGIISCTRAIERLERRMMAAERGGRSLAMFAPDATDFEHAPRVELGTTDTLVPPSVTRRVRKTGSAAPGDAPAPLNGSLNEISLPTLLSMAELERWTGRLHLEARERDLLLELEAGLLIGVFEDDSPTDAVEGLYELIEVRDGRFSFTPGASAVKTEPAPMTVGTLLLRASHRRDERNRVEMG